MDTGSLYCDYLRFAGDIYWTAWQIVAVRFEDANLAGWPSRLWHRGRPHTLQAFGRLALVLLIACVMWTKRGLLLCLYPDNLTEIIVVAPLKLSMIAIPSRIETDAMRDEIARLSIRLDEAQEALHLLALGGVAKKDYALYTTGGRAITHLTSSSRLSPDEPWWNAALATFGSQESTLTARFPWPGGANMALHHVTAPGYCWPFTGTRGHLGIQLSEPIRLQNVTIDHTPIEVSPDRSGAPRSMALWGLVEGNDNLKRTKAWEENRRVLNLRKHPALELDGIAQDAQAILTSAKWVPVAQFEYDIHSPESVQTFSVDDDLHTLDVAFSTVMLLVHDNWGRQTFTCLYRVRVHGTPM